MIGKIIYNRLTTDSGVTAIAGTRTYPLELRQGVTLPAIVYTVISNPRASRGNIAIYRARIQIDCWADTLETANALARAVITAFDGFRYTGSDVILLGAMDVNLAENLEESDKTKRVSVDIFATYRLI